jgi:RimJ/RimL family protein N-acetyltransferase
MTTPHWPLTGLRLTTPRLELRWPTAADLEALGSLAAAGVHDPAVQPFNIPWTDASPSERAESTLQYHWRQWGAWEPANWSLNLVVARDGAVVASQGMAARDYAVLREVSTGSWVGQRYHRRGIGTEMRAAVLHLAFAGLGAEYATSSAFDDNAASLAVSRKLGYADDGIERLVVRGRPVVSRRLRLDRAAWEAHRVIPVEISGLPPGLAYFGLTR